MKAVFFTALFLLSGAAFAEPWCYVKDEKESCRYYSAEQCYEITVKNGGSCKPNPRELGARGGAPWCIMTASSRDCGFRSKTSCLAVARELGPTVAGCVRNTERDLARRARGESRITSCLPGDPNCDDGNDFSLESGLEAAGYGGAPPEPIEPLEPLDGEF